MKRTPALLPALLTGTTTLIAAGSLLSSPLLAGCGSGGGNIAATDAASTRQATGKTIFTIAWPARTAEGRLIPFAANSIRVRLTSTDGTKLFGDTLLTRPSGGGAAAATFDQVPVGAATLTAVAYPGADGSGVAQASAQTSVTVVQGQTTNVALTMASTIAKITIAPATVTLTAGKTVTLAATATDAAGSVVLFSSSTLSWTSSDATVASVDATGKVTTLKAGTATITAKETESGVAATAPVTVQAVAPQIVYRNDFEGAVGQEWSQTTTEVTPLGARRFLGRLGPGPVSLSLANLPAHKSITISFKLFIIRSWDGNVVTNVYGASVGPDLWSLSLDNATLLNTTFGNWEAGSTTDNVLQSYPNAFGSWSFPSRTGASENNTLGYPSFQPPYPGPYQDSVYNLTFTTAHSASTATFVFTGGENSDIADESWGIDDVQVSVPGS